MAEQSKKVSENNVHVEVCVSTNNNTPAIDIVI